MKNTYCTSISDYGTFRRVAYVLSILLIFILPWRALLSVLPGFTIARFVGALAGFVWILYLSQYNVIRQPDVFHIMLFLLVSWVGFSGLWSISFSSTATLFFTLLSGSLFSLVLWDLLRTKSDVAVAAFAYVAGCYILLIIEWTDLIMFGHFRIGDTVSGPNYVAARLAFGLPLAWYVAAHTSSLSLNSSKIHILSIAYLPFAAISLFFTGSRQGSATVAILLFLILLISIYDSRDDIGGVSYFFRRLTKPYIIVIPATVFIGYLFREAVELPLAMENWISAIAFFSGDATAREARIGSRFEIYNAGFKLFSENFLIGTGAGTFSTAIEPLMGSSFPPHNTYLYIGTGTGIIGLTLFLLMVFAASKGIFRLSTNLKISSVCLLSIYLFVSMLNTWFADFTAIFTITMVLLINRT